MFQRTLAAILSGAALLPVMWFNAVDTKFLPTDDSGNLLDYCVVREDAQGVEHTLCYDKSQQVQVFQMSKDFPKPF